MATDRELIARIRAGDAHALGELMACHAPILLRLAAAVTGSREHARDVVQDVFMWLWLQGPALDVRGDVRGYLWHAARNRARNIVRNERTRERLHDVMQAEAVAAPRTSKNFALDFLEAEELAEQVGGALDGVPRRCREIFLLHWRDGLSKDEIAEALEIGVPTVRNQIARAVRRLAEYFSAESVSHTR